jgi:hypothetical protein
LASGLTVVTLLRLGVLHGDHVLLLEVVLLLLLLLMLLMLLLLLGLMSLGSLLRGLSLCVGYHGSLGLLRVACGLLLLHLVLMLCLLHCLLKMDWQLHERLRPSHIASLHRGHLLRRYPSLHVSRKPHWDAILLVRLLLAHHLVLLSQEGLLSEGLLLLLSEVGRIHCHRQPVRMNNANLTYSAFEAAAGQTCGAVAGAGGERGHGRWALHPAAFPPSWGRPGSLVRSGQTRPDASASEPCPAGLDWGLAPWGGREGCPEDAWEHGWDKWMSSSYWKYHGDEARCSWTRK